MRILNVGSLNIDRVYGVDHFAAGGETIAADSFEVFCGGKGLNQSIALARAGATVFHAGVVGADGDSLTAALTDAGVDAGLVARDGEVSGHAILQVDGNGQNSIIVYSGANGRLSEAYIDRALDGFGAGDLLLLQNEVSNVGYAIRRAKEAGLRVALNPSPITPELEAYPLDMVDYMIVNEIEAGYLIGRSTRDGEELLKLLAARFPSAVIVLTLGAAGAVIRARAELCGHGAYQVKAVDTTAAGDTFCGYFLAGIAEGLSLEQSLTRASGAAALAVSRKGASNSIPALEEVERFLKERGDFT